MNSLRQMVEAYLLGKLPEQGALLPASGVLSTNPLTAAIGLLRLMIDSARGSRLDRGFLKHYFDTMEEMLGHVEKYDPTGPVMEAQTKIYFTKLINSLETYEKWSTTPQKRPIILFVRRFWAEFLSTLVLQPEDGATTVENKALNKFQKQWAKYASKILNTLVFVYSILAIELLIYFNTITGVYDLGSTGQIIPFVIGLATFWKTIIFIVTDRVVETPADDNISQG
ncbi:hypothetical protein G7Y89_g680 [Cudoniella acicularis]|uniref:Uncharacterized protein n=1 Tax=Cudoniella acicularis TaxID=354080 RepID=A0A8H4RYP8_9HELO|nr:hypothetical protein G7Y89_g680 [Cudoniella acicularis]